MLSFLIIGGHDLTGKLNRADWWRFLKFDSSSSPLIVGLLKVYLLVQDVKNLYWQEFKLKSKYFMELPLNLNEMHKKLSSRICLFLKFSLMTIKQIASHNEKNK